VKFLTTNNEASEEQEEIIISLDDLTPHQKRSILVIVLLFFFESILLLKLELLGNLFRIFMDSNDQVVISYIVDFLNPQVLYIFFILLGLYLYQALTLLTLEEKRVKDLLDALYWGLAITAFLAFLVFFSSVFLSDPVAIQLSLFLFYLSFLVILTFIPVGIYSFLSNTTDDLSEEASIE
jgi:hypothetical protein